MFITAFFLACIFSFSLFLEYKNFLHVSQYKTFKTTSIVQSVYEKISKKGKKYQVIKLKSEDFSFYTIKWKPLHVKKNSNVEVEFYTKNITFYNYLRGFFTPNKYIKVQENRAEDILHVRVSEQHKVDKMKELYSALFFANPYSKELRYEINKWGVSHLVAISGFHIAMLSAILFFLLRPLYRFFQNRFFPYRNSYADLAFIVFIILGFYVYYIDVVPSVLRAYTMSLVGFFIFSKNIKLISFSTLFLTVCLVLAFFPKLLFSIAFWFSVSGVFYIFLFLHHFSHLSKVSILVLLNFWVYVLMMPVVHYIFDIFTFYQFFSPFISIVFSIFYPLVLALHVVGFGGLLDSYILGFLQTPMQVYSLHVSLYTLLAYLVLSFLSIRYRVLAIFLPIFVVGIFVI